MTAEHSPEEQEEKGFIVSDKRLFTPSGERVTDASPPGPAEPETPPPPKQEEPAAAQQPQTPPTETAPQDLPPVDFASFVMMLTNNVMVSSVRCPTRLPSSRRSIWRRRDTPSTSS